jgi:hypothetical protein
LAPNAADTLPAWQLDELARALPAQEPTAPRLARVDALRADNEALTAELEAECRLAGAHTATPAVLLPV